MLPKSQTKLKYVDLLPLLSRYKKGASADFTVSHATIAEQKKQLLESTKPEDSFVTSWLRLIHMVQSVSVKKFEVMKNILKNRKVSDYPGENAELLASDFKADSEVLHGASACRLLALTRVG